MIITLNGEEGSGKTTVTKRLADALSYKFFYTGQIFRDLAKKRDLTVGEYSILGETDVTVDKEIDDYVVDLSKKNDDFIIDSRMAWHFIPNSIKIYLKVDREVGAQRVYENLQEKNDRNEVRNNLTPEQLMNKMLERKNSDSKRYLMYYGTDIHDLKNYDFVLDTSNLNRDQVFDKIMIFIKSKMHEESH